jgi:cytochrome b561
MTSTSSAAFPVADGPPSGSQRAAPLRYLPVARWLHWAIAALVVLLVTAGVLMKQLGDGPAADLLFILHKTTGAAAFGLILLRVTYRIMARLSGRWHASLGRHGFHRALYGLSLTVPLLGWAGISDFGDRTIAFGLSLPAIWPPHAGYADLLFTLHAYLAFALVATVILHIGVALRDHVMRGSAPTAESDS